MLSYHLPSLLPSYPIPPTFCPTLGGYCPFFFLFSFFQSMTLACPPACCTLYAVVLCEKRKTNPKERVFDKNANENGLGAGWKRRRRTKEGGSGMRMSIFSFCGLYCCTLAWDNA